MSANASPIRLLRMPLRHEHDVVLCRQRARAIAAGLGADAPEQARIATAVSEIARNAVRYAREAAAEFGILPTGPVLIATVSDRGPGIAQLDEVLAGRYTSPAGLGRGIVGAHRLMDRVKIETGADGTSVRMEREIALRGRRAVSSAEVQQIADTLTRTQAVDPIDELALQNRELARALEELQTQREDLGRVNSELAETNRGVLALYDELDTLHRLGRVIASQLDLESLLRAITEATTELTGAEFGALFHRDPPEEHYRCHMVAGPLRDILHAHENVSPTEVFGTESVPVEPLRIDDLSAPDSPRVLCSNLAVRSYLAVPVRSPSDDLVGMMIFGHRAPGRFTERTERILDSVAAQAAVGMENARLYRTAQAANAAKDHFLATLSHELRTPLTPVFVILAGLQSHPNLPEEVRHDLRVMHRNLQLEARLIDDLLDMTRIVKGKIGLQLESVDVHTLLRDTCEICAAPSEEKGISVKLQLDAPRSHVFGDPSRLQQVFWNLLNNSIKFTPAGGDILIHTAAAGERIRIEVRDSGRGIDPLQLDSIFRPFDQGNIGGMTQYGGLGLGLAISRTIVDAHGGTISAESGGAGHGATFIVTLQNVASVPAAAVHPPAPLLAPAPMPRSPAASASTLRILLVDDHADTLQTLGRLLQRRGHRVTAAGSYAEAVAAAERQAFDCLVSDVGLPDRDGVELMRTLRESHGLMGIALSGFGTDADLERSQAAGFAAHLTKPVEFAALEHALANVASRLGASRSTASGKVDAPAPAP